MKRISAVVMLLSFVLITGCAETLLRVSAPYTPSANQKFTFEITNNAKMPDAALTTFRLELTNQLIASDLFTTSADTTARPIHIVIENYYDRRGVTGVTSGTAAGTDNILSTVVVQDSITHNALSSFEIQSKNPAAWGTSLGLIEEHADKIVSYLKSGNP